MEKIKNEIGLIKQVKTLQQENIDLLNSLRELYFRMKVIVNDCPKELRRSPKGRDKIILKNK